MNIKIFISFTKHSEKEVTFLLEQKAFMTAVTNVVIVEHCIRYLKGTDTQSVCLQRGERTRRSERADVYSRHDTALSLWASRTPIKRCCARTFQKNKGESWPGRLNNYFYNGPLYQNQGPKLKDKSALQTVSKDSYAWKMCDWSILNKWLKKLLNEELVRWLSA